MHRSGALAVSRPLGRAVSKPAVTLRAYSTYYPKAPLNSPTSNRPFHTTKALNTSRDNSTIDFAYMPRQDVGERAPSTEVMRIPLLPDNYDPTRTTPEHFDTADSVVKPQISTVSANSTHIYSPSAMSDVTDNHAIDLDPFDLTDKVTSAAAKMTGLTTEQLREPGAVRELWEGLMDDIFGERKVGHA